MNLLVVLHKSRETYYGVTIPDVPGCFSAGATVPQALENVQEALALHYEGLVADGAPLPQVQEMDVHVDNPEYAGGLWALVDFDATPYLGTAVRFSATLPKNLLQRIDDRVKQDNRYASRSAFLASAALRELAEVY
ncbi:type II toxin-antitoxin system HicB family antitoxin [Pseudomonas carassii]|uniref:Type II toxin-antitoxin system HicB family antitoxin n=1 Tax=Pseudomonas carassii TaxID=3115855 RepID=A0ABU7HFQ9_9PSED|nr:type II toxin-antitoxin system HicB family antitoxin [Pseudomonas sp. 137P]MEE1890142.1 type II toxin-antitoxin system HicB family antitoxin [Pseudomonas sp. 137P]